MGTASALTRTLQELNRAVPRVNLRALAADVTAGDPSRAPAAELGAVELREEIAALSASFIEELWGHLTHFLSRIDALLATPSPRGDGFEPLDSLPLDAGAAGADAGAGADPLCEVAVRIEALVISFGRFTEHARAARPTAADHRYRELLSRLPPPGTHTPTSHGAGNALAGMQITLALAEVAPLAFAAQHGRPMRHDELDALVGGASFDQLVNTIGASSARVSNALLAALAPARFPAWQHSLLAMPAAERSARRLKLSPELFSVALDGDEPRLDLLPDALARLRAVAGELETPGRTHHLACPAFAATAGDGADAGADAPHVFGAFVQWLVAICREYLIPLWCPLLPSPAPPSSTDIRMPPSDTD